MKPTSGKGDIKIASDFNVPIINVLWQVTKKRYFDITVVPCLSVKTSLQVVAGDRFDMERPRDASIMEAIRYFW